MFKLIYQFKKHFVTIFIVKRFLHMHIKIFLLLFIFLFFYRVYNQILRMSSEKDEKTLSSFYTYKEYKDYYQQDFNELSRLMSGWKIPACIKKYENATLLDSTKMFKYEHGYSIILNNNIRRIPNARELINTYRFLGFDTESSFGEHSEIRLIQLCFYNKPNDFKVYIIRHNIFKNPQTKNFIQTIFTSTLTKIGCDLRGDADLFRLFDMRIPTDLIDISGGVDDSKRNSLNDLFYDATGLSMQMIRRDACPTFANWKYDGPLTDMLIWYASVDAIAPCIIHDFKNSGVVHNPHDKRISIRRHKQHQKKINRTLRDDDKIRKSINEDIFRKYRIKNRTAFSKLSESRQAEINEEIRKKTHEAFVNLDESESESEDEIGIPSKDMYGSDDDSDFGGGDGVSNKVNIIQLLNDIIHKIISLKKF